MNLWFNDYTVVSVHLQSIMPIGIQRLNAKRSHPNDRIIFIKPLKGPGEKIAQDYLERIAAQCCQSPTRCRSRNLAD